MFKSVMSSRSTPKVKKALAFLKGVIGHDRWFIAGSFAVKYIKKPGDIDVFFYYENDHASACEKFKAISDNSEYITECAHSYYCDDIAIRVQLIKRNFGTPHEIFNTFDLNVCKKAILPDGTRKAHPSSHSDLRITKTNTDTFRRYFKYLNRLGLSDELEVRGRELIDTYIGDSTIMEDYYEGKNVSMPVNKALLKTTKDLYVLKGYAYEQAKIHAPELLI